MRKLSTLLAIFVMLFVSEAVRAQTIAFDAGQPVMHQNTTGGYFSGSGEYTLAAGQTLVEIRIIAIDHNANQWWNTCYVDTTTQTWIGQTPLLNADEFYFVSALLIYHDGGLGNEVLSSRSYGPFDLE